MGGSVNFRNCHDFFVRYVWVHAVFISLGNLSKPTFLDRRGSFLAGISSGEAARDLAELVLEHHCLIVPVVAGIIALFSGPGATATGSFAIAYGVACYFADD